MLHHEFLTYLKILHFPDIGWQNSLCLQWLVLLHGNESSWPDPDCLDPAGSGSYQILKKHRISGQIRIQIRCTSSHRHWQRWTLVNLFICFSHNTNNKKGYGI